MENASKALIIAGSFLVGMIVLSIMVVLFSSFGDTGTKIMQSIQDTQIAEWNNTFLKYVGTENYNVPIRDEFGNKRTDENGNVITTQVNDLPIALTVYDIVTLANYARQTNINNDFNVDTLDTMDPEFDDVNEGSLYIRLDIVNSNGNSIRGYDHLEKRIGSDDFKNRFLMEQSQRDTLSNTKFATLYRVYINDDDANKQPLVSEEHKRLIHMQFVEYTNDQYTIYYQTVQGIQNFRIE